MARTYSTDLADQSGRNRIRMFPTFVVKTSVSVDAAFARCGWERSCAVTPAFRKKLADTEGFCIGTVSRDSRFAFCDPCCTTPFRESGVVFVQAYNDWKETTSQIPVTNTIRPTARILALVLDDFWPRDERICLAVRDDRLAMIPSEPLVRAIDVLASWSARCVSSSVAIWESAVHDCTSEMRVVSVCTYLLCSRKVPPAYNRNPDSSRSKVLHSQLLRESVEVSQQLRSYTVHGWTQIGILAGVVDLDQSYYGRY
jgi:hypothetical protein